MARKNRASAAAVPAAPAEPSAAGVVPLLGLMMFLAPALGVPHEEMLQDTLKSAVVALLALTAAGLFLWGQRGRREPLRWHAALLLPLLLMAYALGSMAWSHIYLGGVEAIRWFVFALIVWLGLNTFSLERLPALALGIHAGAVVASLWAALQFLAGFSFFPQGPPPASTFVNRNFFAEFAVCTLPFAALLLARARQRSHVALLAASTGLVVVSILMTGTRAALIALWLQVLVLLPYIGWLYRRQFAFAGWPPGTRIMAVAVLAATVVGLGAIPTGDPKIADEARGTTGLARAFNRTGSISIKDDSLNTRMVMWKATTNMIRDRPFAGVGAGAWENDITLYQADGAQLETDYYVHNEFLQLIAEYGVVGWIFLAGLVLWLLDAFRRTLAERSPQVQPEGPWRAILLSSLLCLMIVSNAGFAWRMASTGALFALCLGAIAASDVRLAKPGRWWGGAIAWGPLAWRTASAFLAASFVLAIYITQQAAESEQKIVRATNLAMTISASGHPNHPRWNDSKAEMLALIREGIAINRHYRKITPMVADELARWGDWRNATWIWESVLSSRPHVVAILTNVSRGYIAMGNPAKAAEYLGRAQLIQPRAPTVRSLEVIVLARTGREARALELARRAIDDGIVDFDLANTAFLLASRAADFPFAEKALETRMTGWPATRVQGLFQLGYMYVREAHDPARAIDAFKRAVALVPPADRPAVLEQLPAALRAQVEAALAAPAQTSASKG
jgi:O-antigen ligase